MRLIAATLAALAAAATLGTADAVPPGFTLTVTKSGTAAGTVITSPAGIDCGADCSAVFPSGTSVTLKAVEGYRARFAGWSGDCSGTTACVLSMTGDHAVQARFNALGPLGCKVPRLLGLSLAKAKVKLVLANCRLGKVGHKASTRKQKAKVVAQRPRAGTKLKKGGKVNLTLGTGPKAKR